MSDELNQELNEVDPKPIYVADDYDLNDEQLESAVQLLFGIEKIIHQERINESDARQHIYPFTECAISTSHWSHLQNQLANMQEILRESLNKTDKASDLIIRMSSVIAAHKSITEQMVSVYLNLFQIACELDNDEELLDAASETAQELVEKVLGTAKDEKD